MKTFLKNRISRALMLFALATTFTMTASAANSTVTDRRLGVAVRLIR